ncbi:MULTISPECIES: hypothetical protein [unclassified Wenzhouxiangella]|uniref:hypothetical protein n=1 Tax=unclassified Wenzhouxiangella TaxID=2613841 RepID=UPI0011C07E5F|nr:MULTISPECIES: hypothetical protein [unclassified Wenzhouxiangella]
MKGLLPVSFIVATLMLALAGCALFSPASTSEQDTSLMNWHQGFEQGTEGWYDGEDEGPWGWCGVIEAVEERGGGPVDVAPSAGQGYALVSAGPCNDYWRETLPGGAPYAPGPEGSLVSDEWPDGGYVTELDVYLRPSWSEAYEGTLSQKRIIQLGATVFERDFEIPDIHPFPHWIVTVDAVPDQQALDVFDHQIDEAGWYTFRFVFSEEDGEVTAAFELRDRRGDVVTQVGELEPMKAQGMSMVPFEGELPTDEYGSGHIWFMDIASGLRLPIDEHRVRPRR